jgi:hypothetical protein
MAILMIAAPAEKASRLGHSNLRRSLIIPSLALQRFRHACRAGAVMSQNY